MSSEMLVLGKLNGHFGVKGWLKLYSFSDPKEQILDYQPLYIESPDGSWQAVEPEAGKPQGKGLVIKFPDVDNREQAQTLIGRQVAIKREQLQSLADGDFYWHQLIGLEVVNQQAESLGKVVEMLETGANDVLLVKGEAEHLIPYVDAYVLSVSLEQGVITVDWSKDFSD